MKAKIVKYHPDAVIPFKSYKGDFCYDLTAVTEEEVAPDVWRYGFGIGLQIERDNEPIIEVTTNYHFSDKAYLCFDTRNTPLNFSIDIRPRSSVWKTGMVLSNCEGTVDEGYTGEISTVFYHVNKSLPRYRVGDRIAQMKVGFTFPVQFEEVDELNKTNRNDGGYGSSGR